MVAKDIYSRALISLGYEDDQTFKDRAVVVIGQVYDELIEAFPDLERASITSLGSDINLPETVCFGAMVYGVAEKLALGSGDGELQQYFARKYDQARSKLTIIDKIYDHIGMWGV